MHYLFVNEAEFDRLVADGRAAGVGGRARPAPLRHAAGAGAGRPGGGPAGDAGDRPAGRPPGPEQLAERVRCSSRRRPGRSWSAGWSAGAPRPRRSGAAGWRPHEAELAAESEFDHVVVNGDVGQSGGGLGRLARSVVLRAVLSCPQAPHDRHSHDQKVHLVWHTRSPRGSPTRRSTSCSTHSDSKYRLVLFAAKRARQINAYYSQLGEGLLEHVGPLVETGVQEKPLSIALREINAGVLTCIEIDPEAEAAARAEADATPTSDWTRSAPTTWPEPAAHEPGRARGRGRHRGVQGLRAAAAAPRPGTTSRSCPTAARAASSSAPPPGRPCPGNPVHTVGVRRRAPGAARPARPAGRPGRGRTGHRRPARPGRRAAAPTTCSPTCC